MTTSKIHIIIATSQGYDKDNHPKAIVASASKERADELAKKLNDFVEFNTDFENKLCDWDNNYTLAHRGKYGWDTTAWYKQFHAAKNDWLLANFKVPDHLREVICFDSEAKRLDDNLMMLWTHDSFKDLVYSVEEVDIVE